LSVASTLAVFAVSGVTVTPGSVEEYANTGVVENPDVVIVKVMEVPTGAESAGDALTATEATAFTVVESLQVARLPLESATMTEATLVPAVP
jgi:hypothetical protein